MKRFDPRLVPLSGTHLVEAGAGTGKTWGLTALYLRLVAIGRRSPREIAVVTFTDAATRELRTRVRERLARLARRLDGEPAPPHADEEVEALVASLAGEADARVRIARSLLELDDATIATIHGFCRRVLSDFALDAAQPFATLEPGDGERMRAGAVLDFWRRHVVAAPVAEAAWVLSWLASPTQLSQWLEDAIRLPIERIVPRADDEAIPWLRGALDAHRAAAPNAGIARVAAALRASPAMSRAAASPYRADTFDALETAVADWIEGRLADAPLAALGAFTHAGIEAGRFPKKHRDWTIPPDPALDWAQAALDDALRLAWARRSEFLLRALATVRESLARQQREARVTSFDDLVADLRAVLDASPGVVAAVRARYAVALVDEFQDTDADQYAIFRALFHQRDDGALYLIGDPKQSIYRFRGGDVFAYRTAADDAGDNRWTLDDNWRSDERLIEAVNALFSQRAAPPPFIHDFIEFRPAGHGGPRPQHVRSLPVADSPLVVWTADRTEESRKRELSSAIHAAVADEIARLLAQCVGAPPPTIAVLVSNRWEVDGAIEALARRGVPARHSSTASVYAAPEARELAIVLEALADPGDLRRARAALSTELLGFDDDALRATRSDEASLDAALALMTQLRETALGHGPAALARALAQRVGPRWLARHDGRRRMSNLAHVGEALQREARALPGLAAQHAWLARRIASGIEGEENELRPEPGRTAVEVLTVHRSKGLEWDVVFAPFLWSGKRERTPSNALDLSTRRPVTFHGVAGGMFVDLGSPDWPAHAEAREEECRAEAVRLVYVALTRARHRAYTFWAAARTAECSPMKHLLHGDVDPDKQSVAASLAAWAARANDAVCVAPLPMPADAGPPAVPPAIAGEAGPPQLAARTFRGTIDRRFRVLSYSALFGDTDDARPDHDARAAAAPAAMPGPVPARPRGVEFGECVHAILEHWKFGQPGDPENERLVVERARAFGYDAAETAVVRSLVLDTVMAEPIPGVALSSLDARRVELEFFFPLADARLDEVAAALALEPRYARDAAAFADLRPRMLGFMHGYVDLVFAHEGRYGLVDYKTNFLGAQYADYDAGALALAIRAHDYDLQYLIYSVALVRQLRARLGTRFDYARDFAGVAYLFVRGLAGGQGVHRDVPPQAVVEALDRAFGGIR